MNVLSLPVHLAAVASLLPVAGALYWRPPDRAAAQDALYWALLALAVAGPIALCLGLVAGGWRPGFGVSLWVTAAGSMAIFAVLAVLVPTARRLALLVAPYLAILGAIATIWNGTETIPLAAGERAIGPWLTIHIVLAVAAYAVVTLAAIASLALTLQERALKRRRPSGLSRRLPAAAEAEALEHRLLIAAEILLGLGVASGMGAQMVENGALLVLEHKTLLTLAAFVAIGGLLWARARYGLRGRRAARLVLVAYLLITLGFPGVKFVTDVLVG